MSDQPLEILHDAPPLPLPQTRGKVCPKCSYTRLASDPAPAWQCPRCQVAYDKVVPAPVARRAEKLQPALEAQQPKAPSRPWLVVGVGLLAIAVPLLAWQWRSANPAGGERMAKARSDARNTELAAARQKLADTEAIAKAEAQINQAQAPEAFATFSRLASQGNTRAMVGLALMHREGRGTPRNHEQAMAWLRKAADEGEPLAFVNLGHSFEYGLGESRQPEHAANWYLKAARLGHGAGLYALGDMYARGAPGLGSNPVLAHMLLDLAERENTRNPAGSEGLLASRKGAAWAAGDLRMLAKTMSPVDVVRARELADAWQPGQPFPL